MGLFKKKTKSPSTGTVPEHAVIVHYALTGDEHGTVSEREAVFELENSLIATIEAQSLGDLDGNEFGGGEAVLYCYGPDAGRLFAGIEATLRAFPARPAHVMLRYGDVSDPHAQEQRIDL
jgi:hypothetical protein